MGRRNDPMPFFDLSQTHLFDTLNGTLIVSPDCWTWWDGYSHDNSIRPLNRMGWDIDKTNDKHSDHILPFEYVFLLLISRQSEKLVMPAIQLKRIKCSQEVSPICTIIALTVYHHSGRRLIKCLSPLMARCRENEAKCRITNKNTPFEEPRNRQMNNQTGIVER